MTKAAKNRSSTRLQAGWVLVLCVSLLSGLAVFMTDAVTAKGRLVYGPLAIGFSLISIAGLARGWGKPVLFTIGGFYFGLFLAPSPYSYTHNAYEEMMEAFGIPVFYSVMGAVVGFTAEYIRKALDEPPPRSPRPAPDGPGTGGQGHGEA